MKRFQISILAIFIILGLFSCDYKDPNQPRTITGLVDATEIDVASKIPGRISEVFVKEGDTVKEGDKLLSILSEEIAAKIDQVEAAIEAAQAQLKMAKKGARKEEKEAVKKQMEAAQHQVDITKKMYDRIAKLRETGAVAQSKFEEVEFKYNISLDQLAMAEAKYTIVKKGARAEQIEALAALVKQGEGTLAEVESYNKETTQFAPINGEISKVILHKGELAATGYPLITLVDMSDIWATFAVREDMLSSLKKGQEIQVFIPALNKNVKMKIFNISAMGDFATWKATNDRNSFDLKSFEIKARPVEVVENLRPGMTIRWTE